MQRKRFRWLRRLLRIALITAAVWLLVGCTLATLVHVYGQSDRAQQADVIIVLGSSLRRDNEPGPSLVRRAQHAAERYAAGDAPVIICTGGFTIGRTRSEADGCRQVLLAVGVPASAIRLEERSRSTQENALYAADIMRENGWADAVLVSDGYHLLRAQWIFTLAGIPVYPSPAPTRPRLSAYIPAVAREVAALHWQLLVTTLRLPYTNFPP